MLFSKNYEIIREGSEVIAVINVDDYTKIPAIEDDPVLMQRAVDVIVETGAITKLIFAQKRRYEYDEEQTEYLNQIAKLYKVLVADKNKAQNCFVLHHFLFRNSTLIL